MIKKISLGFILLSVALIRWGDLNAQQPTNVQLSKPPVQTQLQKPPAQVTAPKALPTDVRAPSSPSPQTEMPSAPTSVPTKGGNVPTIGNVNATGPQAGTTSPAVSTAAEGEKKEVLGEGSEEMVYLNVQDADIKDVIKQISKATGKNFIIDAKVTGKITIISERAMTREEAYQTFLSALEVAGFTVVKGPADVIRIVATKEAVTAPIPTHVDTTPYTSSYITRLIPLQNISALDMSSAIKDLVSKNGNMFAYPATNTLIITDSGANIDRLMKIIKELDQEGPQQVLEIIPIRNAAAKDIAQLINSLYEKKQQDKNRAGRKTAGAGGSQLEEIEEVSQIIADDRTNSVIVLASKRAIEKVKDLIAKLDVRIALGDEGKIHVYYLKHAKAKDLAETLSSLTSAAGKSQASQKAGAPAGAGTAAKTDIVIAEFEGGLKITADEATNALIVTSTPKDFKTLVDRVISKLDIPRRQVYLEAVIMELQIEKNKAYGMSGHGGKNIGGSLIGFGQSFQAAANLLSLFTAVGPGSPTVLGGLIGSNTVNFTVPSATGTGTQTVSVPTMSALVAALQTYSDANVVSTPNLLTLDNQEASIEVTREVAVAGQQIVTSAGIPIQGSPQYIPAGLKLKITPQIGEADSVMLKIEQELSNFGAAATNALAPPKQSRKVSTTVVTKDGETVVLGGLMEDEIRNAKEKVPLLGDIPILGFLFSHTSQQKGKRNLLIFITPHIVKDSSDFAEILKKKIEERNRFVDNNYGKGQRRVIRETIRSHREDLLEYTPKPQTEYEAEPPIILPSEKLDQKPSKTEKADKKTSSRPPDYLNKPTVESSAWKTNGLAPTSSSSEGSKPPVITVPSVDERAYQKKSEPEYSTSKTSGPKKKSKAGEVDSAY